MINKFEKDGLYFIALGGADEIGMNMYVYACNGKFIMVDAGYGFLNDNYPGIDLCFADAGFFANYAEDFEGIFITCIGKVTSAFTRYKKLLSKLFVLFQPHPEKIPHPHSCQIPTRMPEFSPNVLTDEELVSTNRSASTHSVEQAKECHS